MTQIPEIKHASVIEAQIVGRLVTDLLAAGLTISVWNGGDEAEIEDSDNAEAIFAELAASDEDELTMRHGKGGAYAGWVRLVWGNDHSVISDYSVRLEAQVEAASKLADPESIVDATTRMCIFWQNESARAYAAARWEYENGAISRTPAAQERAAEYAREVEVRLSQLVGV